MRCSPGLEALHGQAVNHKAQGLVSFSGRYEKFYSQSWTDREAGGILIG